MSFEKPDLWKVCEDGGWAVLNSHGETESDHLHIGDAEMIVEWHNRAVLAEAQLDTLRYQVQELSQQLHCKSITRLVENCEKYPAVVEALRPDLERLAKALEAKGTHENP